MEGLGDIVVGAHFEPDDAVDHVALAGDHDDGNVRALAHLAGDGEPVGAAEVEVERDEVDRLAQGQFHLGRTAGLGDAKPLVLEAATQEAPDLRVVVHHQDMLLGHAARHPPLQSLTLVG